jgi:hypothetical protein
MTPVLIPKGQPVPPGVRIVGEDERGTWVVPKTPIAPAKGGKLPKRLKVNRRLFPS